MIVHLDRAETAQLRPRLFTLAVFADINLSMDALVTAVLRSTTVQLDSAENALLRLSLFTQGIKTYFSATGQGCQNTIQAHKK